MKKLKSLWTGIFLLTIFTVAGISCAADYYVSPTGDDAYPGTFAEPFATIQRGINAAVAGDTIFVNAGTYNENITMKSGINVIGNSPDNTIISGSASINGTVLFPDVTCAILRGFTITVSEPVQGTDRGVVFNGNTSYSAVLQNCIIYGVQYGIYVWAPATPSIINNVLDGKGTEEQGIYIGNEATAPQIINNIISGWTIGIHIFDQADPFSNDPNLEYNDVWDNTENNYLFSYDFPTTIDEPFTPVEDFENFRNRGNISANPLFVNPAVNDYHLATGSPCIGSGFPNGQFQNPQILNPGDGGFDRGAYGGGGNTLLSITKSGTGDGAVTSSGGTWLAVYPLTGIPNYQLNCPSSCTGFIPDPNICAPCSSYYTAGSGIMLTATADPGSFFGGWSGCVDPGLGATRSQNFFLYYTPISAIFNLCTDADGDTYAVEGGDCGPIDCDDSDDTIHPGAAEVCDGVDNNCVNGIDEGFPDLDQDGIADCVDPDTDGDGYYDPVKCGLIECPVPFDCNDTDNSIYPGAPEIPNDGIDQDCSGIDLIQPSVIDTDGDEIPDDIDNCPKTDNNNQTDSDKDGRGDACDNQDEHVYVTQRDLAWGETLYATGVFTVDVPTTTWRLGCRNTEFTLRNAEGEIIPLTDQYWVPFIEPDDIVTLEPGIPYSVTCRIPYDPSVLPPGTYAVTATTYNFLDGTDSDGNPINFFGSVTSNAGTLEVVDPGFDGDGDGVGYRDDACPDTEGRAEYQGCPIADKNTVMLHTVTLGGKNPLKVPLAGVLVRVFDRNNADFQEVAGSKNPDGSLYSLIFETDDAPEINLGRVGSCVTDIDGVCYAGETSIGDYLVIIKYSDPATGFDVYVGRPKSPGDFVDTDNDGMKDRAEKNFQIIKVFKNGEFQGYRGGKKTSYTGSLLEVIEPESAIWEGTQSIYPFIFASEGTWDLDVCAQVPAGYAIYGVYDENGNLFNSSECAQTLVAGEEKVIAFEVVETSSPEPEFNGTLSIKHNGKVRKAKFSVKDLRKDTLKALVKEAKEKAKDKSKQK